MPTFTEVLDGVESNPVSVRNNIPKDLRSEAEKAAERLNRGQRDLRGARKPWEKDAAEREIERANGDIKEANTKIRTALNRRVEELIKDARNIENLSDEAMCEKANKTLQGLGDMEKRLAEKLRSDPTNAEIIEQIGNLTNAKTFVVAMQLKVCPQTKPKA
jgi:predicted  nucleic acid-binding Zn-ribbon protein